MTAPSIATLPRVNGRARGRWRLMVPTARLSRATFLALGGALLLYPAYAPLSRWLGVGVALGIFTLVHAIDAAYRTVWLPGVIAVAACIQWVLAAWSDYGIPGRMAVPPAIYFRFATLSTIAFVLGLYLPLWKFRPAVVPAGPLRGDPGANVAMARTCRMMVLGGVFTRVVLLPFAPLSLRYAGAMVGMLAFVGALSLMLLAEPKWPIWVTVAFAPVAFSNASDLQFLDAMQYLFCTACVALYRFRPRRSSIALLAVPGIVLFFAISAFKVYNRDELRQQDLSGSERAGATSRTLVELMKQPSIIFAPEMLNRTVARLNEGWITSRLLAWTPMAQPYAEGETLVTALRATLLPRILDPGKLVIGGKDIIPRFTGIQLLGSTSMGLSIPGEMYANFGIVGAVLGTFLYGVFLSSLYRAFARRAQASILWWAWAPLIFFSTLSPEQGFAENSNHVAKTLLLMWVFVRTVPAWRALPRRVRKRSAMRVGVLPSGATGDLVRVAR